MNVQDILFEYLRKIIYDTENAELDLEQLPPEFRKLGMGMQLLGKWISEEKKLNASVSRGDLTYEGFDSENVLIGPIKELQGNLRHLTWQTKQVAKGDYSQKVDFMGEFSEAFNTMTRLLQERRLALIREKQEVEAKNEELRYVSDLVNALTNHSHNMIFIHSADDGKELFRNAFAGWFLDSRPEVGKKLLERLVQKTGENIESGLKWDVEICCGVQKDENYFNVESYPMLYEKRKALVHIVVDDTERRIQENLFYRFAYTDVLTGLYNRRYAMEKMQEWADGGKAFVLTFIDVDGLKYCNDVWGHKMGDAYLMDVARTLKTVEGTVCRIGGDEFITMTADKTVEEQEKDMEKARSLLKSPETEESCPRSFSYACCMVPSPPEKSLEDYLAQADTLMYKYKAVHKKSPGEFWYTTGEKELRQ